MQHQDVSALITGEPGWEGYALALGAIIWLVWGVIKESREPHDPRASAEEMKRTNMRIHYHSGGTVAKKYRN